MTELLYGLFVYSRTTNVLLSKNPYPVGLGTYWLGCNGVHPTNTHLWQRVVHKELTEW